MLENAVVHVTMSVFGVVLKGSDLSQLAIMFLQIARVGSAAAQLVSNCGARYRIDGRSEILAVQLLRPSCKAALKRVDSAEVGLTMRGM